MLASDGQATSFSPSSSNLSSSSSTHSSDTSHFFAFPSCPTPSAPILEPVYPPEHVQLLSDMRSVIAARTKHGVVQPSPSWKPPISLHWRDLYHRYRHLTTVRLTPDPRLSPSYSPPCLSTPRADYSLYRFLKARSLPPATRHRPLPQRPSTSAPPSASTTSQPSPPYPSTTSTASSRPSGYTTRTTRGARCS